jgi:hypothetical protein
LCSHFFEFVDDRGRIHLAHALRKDEIYEIVVTTSGGLWRYQLHDEVQVTGFMEQTPTLKFLGRQGNVSDRFGEKLSEVFVAQALQELLGNLPTPPCFTLLAPDENHLGCCYTFYIQGAVQHELAKSLDVLLMKNPHYAWCRKLGQLQTPRLYRIKNGGYETFLENEISNGKRLGEIKPCLLSRKTGWSQCFEGNYLD